MLEIIRDIDAEVELEENTVPTTIEPLNTRSSQRSNSHLIKEAMKELNKTETIDYKKSMNVV